MLRQIMPYCRACGIEVDPTISYCPDCGEELDFGATETVGESAVEPRVEERETVGTEPRSELEPSPETEQEPDLGAEPTIGDGTEPAILEVENEPEEGPSSGVSIWAKLGVVICIPIALVGLLLEVASVYTLSIGEYNPSEFVVASIIFGLVTFLPIAYIYWVYKRSTWSVRRGV